MDIKDRVELLQQTFPSYNAVLDAKVRRQDKYGIDWCSRAKKILAPRRKCRENCWFLQIRVPNDFMTRERFDECAKVCGYSEQKQAWGIQALKRLDAETNARKRKSPTPEDVSNNGERKIE